MRRKRSPPCHVAPVDCCNEVMGFRPPFNSSRAAEEGFCLLYIYICGRGKWILKIVSIITDCSPRVHRLSLSYRFIIYIKEGCKAEAGGDFRIKIFVYRIF